MKKKILFITFSVLAIALFTPNVYADDNIVPVNSWTTLEECLKSDDGKTCQLSSNIAVESGKNYILMKTLTKPKILDLQNYTLNLSNTLYVYGSNLTITGTKDGKIIGHQDIDKAIEVYKGGTLEIENVTIENTNRGGRGEGQALVVSEDNATLTVKESATIKGVYGIVADSFTKPGCVVNVYGTIIADEEGGFGITINGELQDKSNAPTINIYSGSTITSQNAPAIYAAGYGIWNINGGNITGSEALSIKSGIFNITGGTLKATGDYVKDPEANSNGNEPTGSAISVTANESYAGDVVINISGNTKVESKNGYAIFEGITADDKTVLKEIKITDGEFIGSEALENEALHIESFEDETSLINLEITGGTYSSNIMQYIGEELPAGKTLHNNGDGTYSIIDITSVPTTPEDNGPDTADVNVYGLLTIILVSGLGLGYVIRKRMN